MQIVYAFTWPPGDWLFGVDYAALNTTTDLETGEQTYCEVYSLGFLFIRIDLLIPLKKEEQ